MAYSSAEMYEIPDDDDKPGYNLPQRLEPTLNNPFRQSHAVTHKGPPWVNPATRSTYNLGREIESLRDRLARSERQLGQKDAHIEKLHHDLFTARCTIGSQAVDREEVQAVRLALHDSHRFCRELQQNLAVSRQKEAQLRAVILEKASNQAVSDHEMISMFVSLRRQIQNIARLSIFDMRRPPTRLQTAAGDDFWTRLNREERVNRVRAELFDIIHDNFLGCPLFGLEGHADAATPDLGDMSLIAGGLRGFETALETKQVDRRMIEDWRLLTLDCAEKLNYPSTGPVEVAAVIWRLLEPLRVSPSSSAGEKEVEVKVVRLCHDAQKLRLIMRRSQHTFQCLVPGPRDRYQSAADWDQLVEPVAIEGGAPDPANNEIAYTLFGALFKQGTDGGVSWRVLEKAAVILKPYRRDDVPWSSVGEPGVGASELE